MRVSAYLFFKLFFLVLLFPTIVLAHKDQKLNSEVIKGIVEQFVSMHYSQKPLDDEMSSRIFSIFLNRLDPAHYYFLEDDVKNFQKYETRVDDMLRRGDANLAFDIFERFKERLSERLSMLEEFLKEDFNFSKDAKWTLDRSDQPYPSTKEEARIIWRTKIKFDLLTLKLSDTNLNEGKERLMKRVRGLWKEYSQYDNDDIVSMFINSMAAAYDPHSSYLAAQDLKNFDISIKLSLEGIGAVLRWEDGYTVVNSIVPGGAAARNGKLNADDKIIAVAQGNGPFESVIDMRLNDVVQLIRGKRGTKVGLQILRKSKKGFDTLKIAIIRDKIVLKDGEAQSNIFNYPLKKENKLQNNINRIGIIKLPSFYVDFNDRRKNPKNFKSASRDVKSHITKFIEENVDGVILDLRNNGGGGLDEAINMAGLFIGQNPVVVVRQSGGRRITVHRSRQKAIYKGPLLVMLNRYSASASEILAGALHDFNRAILVGDTTTFGKGTVQNIFQLPEGYGALKVTIAQFYRVSGWSTQNRGVESNITLPSINNVREIGESTLENALPWRSIDPVSYESKRNLSKNIIPKLKILSDSRITSSDFFQKINEDIDLYLNSVKDLKYTSILKIQEDDATRKSKRELEISNSKKNEGDLSANDDSEDKKELQLDDYIRESMAILADFISLTSKN
mgnify:FL=1|tara:strand:+ start:286 stop:2313 length:2028 start_codon:yes stop_codon:yes gene_type:complete